MTASTSDRDLAPFRHDGSDIGVLLLHGFTGAPGSMRGWADHLADAGYTVRLPLLPGHGTRWQDMNRTTFDDWLAEATSAFQDLAASRRAVFICGLSMGGTLALRLAELYPDAVAGIALVNPSVLTERWDAKWLLPWVNRVVPRFPGITSDIAKPGVTEPGYEHIPTKAAYSLSRAWPVVRAGLPTITAPVLLMHSTVDHVVEPVNATVVRAEIGSTDVTDIELTRSYHVATLDYDADLIFTTSVEFIEKVTASLP
jgi:carboxylesterase